MHFDPEIVSQYIPVIFSLIVMEGLLSVDNAMIIAAMVDHLPENQKKMALTAGLFGAYFFRGLMLFFAEALIKIWWLKLLGAAYLIYLMVDHLGSEEEDDIEDLESTGRQQVHGKGFWATVLTVELTDVAFSIDNVIAAVALSPHLWVVVTGVFIGIAAMRFVAGFFIDIMRKVPVLKPTAYVLVGLVGVLLVLQEAWHFHLSPLIKFGVIGGIIGFAYTFERVEPVRNLTKPVFDMTKSVFKFTRGVINFPFTVFQNAGK